MKASSMSREARELRAWAILNHGGMTAAAKVAGIHPSTFSFLAHRYRDPFPGEREKLRRALGPYYFRKFFGKPRAAKIEGTDAINE